MNPEGKKLLEEITAGCNGISDQEIQDFADEIASCTGVIVGIGAGRMGYAMRAFIMRLSHLGYKAYMIGDTSLPRISSGDLVVVGSSSGETPTNVLLARQSKNAGAKLMLVTSERGSTIGCLADIILFLG